MKKLSIFTFLMVIIFNSVFSQEIILTFVPASDTLTIDSIQATNLATNESLTVAGGESVNLNAITTGTIEFEMLTDNSLVYPNPFQDYATLQFTTTRIEFIRLKMINSAGESVATYNQNLSPGNHQFKITANSPGIYLLNIQSGERNISHKLVSLTKGKPDRIEYSGANGEAVSNKSLKVTQTEQVFHFKIYSGENVTLIADSPAESKTYEVEFYECKDADGQYYPIVQIGNQWWMAENLAYLPAVSPASSGSDTAKHYYVYGYNGTDVNAAKTTDNYSTYGVLYNWPAVMNGSGSSNTNSNSSGLQGICPEGWHLPSDLGWKQLEMALGMTQAQADAIGGRRGTDQGTQMKTTYGWYNNGNGTNTSGFSALPGGHRDNRNGKFMVVGYYGFWWNNTEYDSSGAWFRFLPDYDSANRNYDSKAHGFSVRCVRIQEKAREIF